MLSFFHDAVRFSPTDLRAVSTFLVRVSSMNGRDMNIFILLCFISFGFSFKLLACLTRYTGQPTSGISVGEEELVDFVGATPGARVI